MEHFCGEFVQDRIESQDDSKKNVVFSIILIHDILYVEYIQVSQIM